jgi:hypothetical protein
MLWHWGDNGSFKAFVIAEPKTKAGVVMFANSEHGLEIAGVRRLGVDNSVFAVIRTLQHRPRHSNRCVGQTLTLHLRGRQALAAAPSLTAP